MAASSAAETILALLFFGDRDAIAEWEGWRGMSLD
jgi:hypothetical protein